MRRILPRSVSSRWPLPCGSPPEPPSPMRDVEHPVRPERERAAVVVGERLGDRQQDELGVAGRRGPGRRVHAERRDDRVAVEVGVVDEEPRVGREVRVEGEAEQAALAARRDPVRRCRGTASRRRSPSVTIRIVPPCSTTKIRPLPSPARRDVDRRVEQAGDDRQGHAIADRIGAGAGARTGPGRGGRGRRRRTASTRRSARRRRGRGVEAAQPPTSDGGQDGRRAASDGRSRRHRPMLSADASAATPSPSVVRATAGCYPAPRGGPPVMLDRLISGAGAVTDAADRLVRALGRGAGDGFARPPPGIRRRRRRLRRPRGHPRSSPASRRPTTRPPLAMTPDAGRHRRRPRQPDLRDDRRLGRRRRTSRRTRTTTGTGPRSRRGRRRRGSTSWSIPRPRPA